MNKSNRPVREEMTHLPHEAEKCETVSDALQLMDSHGVHHLPIMNGSHLAGIVSQQDLLCASGSLGRSANDTLLEEICRKQVLKVSPMMTIKAVAQQMLEQKSDAAVVVDGGYVVGIFTTTDALRVLSG